MKWEKSIVFTLTEREKRGASSVSGYVNSTGVAKKKRVFGK